MSRHLRNLVPTVALFVALLGANDASAQERLKERGPDHPKLRAALQELREAQAELKGARDNWPPGYRDQAQKSIQDAIQSLRTILAVKDVDTFRGYERNDDYYKHFNNHPKLRSALQDLRQARRELEDAKADFHGQKESALDNIDHAISSILRLVRHETR